LTYAGNILTIKDELDDPRVTFEKIDSTDFDAVTRIVAPANPDYIVNFAAESHVDRSITSPRIFLETNIIGTQSMLEAAKELWRAADGTYPEGKKYLQISTDEVYGSLPKEYDEPQTLELDDAVSRVVEGRDDLHTYGTRYFTETSPLQPRSPYSASKASADLITLAYGETYGLPVNITRCSNNYGPYHFPEKLIPLMIKNLLDGKNLPVYGKGENVRDWLYVADHCRAIDLVLRRGKVGEIYNIGGFNESRNIDIVRLIIDGVARRMADSRYRKLLADPTLPIDESRITYVADRPGHDMRYAIDPTKIATQLGWYPSTPFTQGIQLTIDWYLDHPEWVESVTSGDYQRYYDEMYTNREQKVLN
ncbi:MAG: dTDP-glucose 4,6-dehydratase, partial [Muribaculaceae bacterium]|nr:dTDP-glucose 4,6-dehydratase [Muribaculaceae bacterium]